MKAVVTGCAGFVGSHLTERLLSEGYEVTGIDCFTDYYSKGIKEENISQSLDNKNFKFIEKDILEIESFPGTDYVFHLAAQAGVRASWGKSFEVYTKNNIEATQKLLEAYKDEKIKKFVYSSSSSIYGDSPLPMREEYIPKPVSPYGVTKLAGEHLCYLYNKNYGIPAISLRYFTVYGPRQRPDMAIHKFVKAAFLGRKIEIYGDGTQTRDFTYVDDAVQANILAARSDYSNEIFNVGGGTRISVNGLLKEIEKASGKTLKISNIDKQKGDVSDTMADTEKIRKMLSWVPETKIEKGIERFVKWFESSNK
jgi:nucleoside-diphosphate-sugar epimerase